MAYEDELQKVRSIFGDVGDVVDTGLSLFGKVADTFYPDWSQSPPAPVKIPEPISAKPIVLAGAPLSFDNPMLLLGIGVIGYLWLSQSK